MITNCGSLIYSIFIQTVCLLYTLTIYSPVHALRTSRFNIKKNFRFAHTVYLCYVWVAAPTTMNLLYAINWWVFITQTQYVYCAVRTECLNKIQFNAEARVRYQARAFVLDKGHLDKFSESSILVSFCLYHSTVPPYSSSTTRCSYQIDKWLNPGENREHWMESILCYVFKGLMKHEK